MRITHFGHACVLIETASARLLFDPGTFSSGFETLTDLDAVLITHQHFDHLDGARLPALLTANPGAELVVDPGSAAQVRELGLTARTATSGETLKIAGAQVGVVGGEHALIHEDVPGVPNVGYVVDDGGFYHPGDSFFVPEQEIDVLGLPTAAPWLKLSEAVDYLRAVAPRVAVPIHEALLADPTLYRAWFARLAPEGVVVTSPGHGEATAI